MKILHITPHLGGGIGKALIALQLDHKIDHNIVCLEKPEKNLNELNDNLNELNDKKIMICPKNDGLKDAICNSDIIQLEWINHPTTIKYLQSEPFNQPIRLITWYHNNGLYSLPKNNGKLPPILPKNIIKNSSYNIFTNECSFQCKVVQEILKENPDISDKLGTVYSSGGFEGFPDPNDSYTRFSDDNIYLGYFGSLQSFTKIHPDFIKYIDAININLDKVKMIGEYKKSIYNQLTKQSHKIEKPILQFTGYIEKKEDLVKELSSINVLVYILNPKHYGTTENSLLEAMSMGIVPIVLNNPAELNLVKDYETGLIVKNYIDFRDKVQWLNDNPDERQRIGLRASKEVRNRFSSEKTKLLLNRYYENLMNEEKRIINFKDIFDNNGQ